MNSINSHTHGTKKYNVCASLRKFQVIIRFFNCVESLLHNVFLEFLKFSTLTKVSKVGAELYY